MRVDLRDAIKEENDLPRRPVATPEWPAVDGQLQVRTLTASDMEAFGTTLEDANVRARFLVRTICDNDGVPVFGEEDAEWLAGKNSSVVARLWQEACRLNGLAEDPEKNSATTPDGNSPSSSPLPLDDGTSTGS